MIKSLQNTSRESVIGRDEVTKNMQEKEAEYF